MAYNFGDRWLQRAQDSGGPGTIYCHASFSPNRSRRSLSQPDWTGDSRGVGFFLSPHFSLLHIKVSLLIVDHNTCSASGSLSCRQVARPPAVTYVRTCIITKL